MKYKIANYSSGQELGLQGGGNARPKMHFTTAPELNQPMYRGRERGKGGEMLASVQLHEA